MADYRQVHTKMWTDEWFLELEPDAKLLWIYLFSNKRACLSGLYDIPMVVMMFETGLGRDAIERHLVSFAEVEKAYYEDGWLLIPKLMRYNAHNITSPKIQGNLKNDVFAAPNIRLKGIWLDEYNALIPPDKTTYRMSAKDIGYAPIPDTVPDRVSDKVSDTLHLEQNNTEQNNKGADAPTSYNDWLKALRSPKSVGETNGIGVLVQMGQALYDNFPPSEKNTYGRVAGLAKQAGSQSKFADILWRHASKPLAAPLDYLTSVVEGGDRKRGDPTEPAPRKMRQTTAGGGA